MIKKFENFLNELLSTISDNINLIKTNKDIFDFLSLKNRRFMYNPKTKELVFGNSNVLKGRGVMSSHAEELELSGAIGTYDDFIRGWVSGTAKGYKNGIIHFAPSIYVGSEKMFNDAFSTLYMFKRFGANPGTIIRGFGEETKLSNILKSN